MYVRLIKMDLLKLQIEKKIFLNYLKENILLLKKLKIFIDNVNKLKKFLFMVT